LCYVGVTRVIPGIPVGWRRQRDIAVGTHLLGAARRRPKHKSTALQYIYGGDVSRHRRHPEPRLRLGKSIVLRRRHTYHPEVPGAWLGEEGIVQATHMLGAARRRPKHKSTALQYIYGGDVSRHRRHPESRLVMLPSLG
jgi:hypothetical protein